jgi:hypothetical protein
MACATDMKKTNQLLSQGIDLRGRRLLLLGQQGFALLARYEQENMKRPQ